MLSGVVDKPHHYWFLLDFIFATVVNYFEFFNFDIQQQPSFLAELTARSCENI